MRNKSYCDICSERLRNNDTDNRMISAIHQPEVPIKKARFFRPFAYQNSVPMAQADAVLFPWILKDTMVFSSPAVKLQPLRTVFKEKKPGWQQQFNLLLRDLSVEVIENLLARFRKQNNISKPILLMTDMDVEGPFWQDEMVYFFRCSLVKSNQLPNEFALPYLKEDRGVFVPSEHSGVPSIGFCGYADHQARIDLLNAILQHPTVEEDFYYRKDYFWAVEKKLSREQSMALTEQYFASITNNPFTVCSRGAGNYSIRFYETLRSGRIPVLLNTDMAFPFPDRIPWDDIIICRDTPDEVLDTVLDWWQNKDIPKIQQQLCS